MDARIDRCVESDDPCGLFAIVYRTVTARVRDGIEKGLFENGERMERFDVLFARRYLDAFHAWDSGGHLPSSWALAFETGNRTNRIALQHVLLGINAHINLDLGIAAAEAAKAGQVTALKNDFERINDVLADLVDRMQDAIATVSPWTRLVDQVGLRFDESLVGFVLRGARRHAWEFAETLSSLSQADRSALIAERDESVTQMGLRIASPSGPLRWAIAAARLREHTDLAAVAGALEARVVVE